MSTWPAEAILIIYLSFFSDLENADDDYWCRGLWGSHRLPTLWHIRRLNKVFDLLQRAQERQLIFNQTLLWDGERAFDPQS